MNSTLPIAQIFLVFIPPQNFFFRPAANAAPPTWHQEEAVACGMREQLARLALDHAVNHDVGESFERKVRNSRRFMSRETDYGPLVPK
jgi:hypothetical protein